MLLVSRTHTHIHMYTTVVIHWQWICAHFYYVHWTQDCNYISTHNFKYHAVNDVCLISKRVQISKMLRMGFSNLFRDSVPWNAAFQWFTNVVSDLWFLVSIFFNWNVLPDFKGADDISILFEWVIVLLHGWPCTNHIYTWKLWSCEAIRLWRFEAMKFIVWALNLL